jgi:cytochrome c oxidase subunit III
VSEISHMPVEAQPVLAHHFDDVEQQHEANTFGMWVFLVTEVLFFGGVLLAYVVFRTLYPDGFGEASHHLNVPLGGLNTFVLLTSSLSVVLAIYYVRLNRKWPAVGLLLLTVILGAVFLGIKAVEWITDWHEGLIPGLNWP